MLDEAYQRREHLSENRLERGRPRPQDALELTAGETSAFQSYDSVVPNFHRLSGPVWRHEMLFRKSVAAGIQSRARQQADSELVIGLPCPLPHGRGSVGAFGHRHFHASLGPVQRDEALLRKEQQTPQNIGVAIAVGLIRVRRPIAKAMAAPMPILIPKAPGQ